MSKEQPDHAKKMQTMGFVLLIGLFGGWIYLQSRMVSDPANRVESRAGSTGSSQQLADSGALRNGAGSLAQAQLSPAAADAQTESQSTAAPRAEEQTETEAPVSIEPIVIETEVYRAEISPQGAVLHSLILKKHSNDGQALEMVRSADSGMYPFTVYLGSYLDGQPVLLPFRSEQIGPRAYRFKTEFTLEADATEVAEPYILEKTLEFAEREYMVKINVRLQRRSGAPLLQSGLQNQHRVIYSLYYGPQMGPEVEHIGRNRTAADMRNYVYYNGKKSKTVSLSRSGRDKQLESSPIWAGVSGKYFGVFGLPSRNLDIYWSGADVPGLGLDASGKPLESSQFLFERRAARSDDNLADDEFYYYIGPLLADQLGLYNQAAENEFGISDASLNALVKFSLGFIEEPVKWMLTWLYGFTHNYGLAIILFALIVRLLLYPLSVKSFHSASRMRQVQPRMKEIQEKFKGDPRRLQQEMAQLYRREKVNPMGGCLPLLVQMPILIAIANLFYRYFELRGATFIPGWIGDLSSPDLVYSLELSSSNIPLRLLPLIYLGSQLISSKLMQAGQPPMQNKIQQRMFTVYMPIFFSIILYNMPSGLILYWTISNLLMMVQQLLMSRYYKGDKAKDAVGAVAQQSRNFVRHSSRRGGGPNATAGQRARKGSVPKPAGPQARKNSKGKKKKGKP